MIRSSPEPVSCAEDAAVQYAQTGLFWVQSLLNPAQVQELHNVGEQRFQEALRAMKEKQDALAQEHLPVPDRFSEIFQKDGGRYDCRHGMDSEPFSSLFLSNGWASSLIPMLQHVVSKDAEVATLGLIVAKGSCETDTLHPRPGRPDEMLSQAWHMDGSSLDETTSRALTVFIPLCDLTPTNGATEFHLGSHRADASHVSDAVRQAESTVIYLSAGSAVAFSTRLWHRGLRNSDVIDRLVLYAIISQPIWKSGEKMLPVLVGGSTSVFTGEDVLPQMPFVLGGQREILPCFDDGQLEINLELPDSEDDQLGAEDMENSALVNQTNILRQELLQREGLSLTQYLPQQGPLPMELFTTLRICLMSKVEIETVLRHPQPAAAAPRLQGDWLDVCEMLRNILESLQLAEGGQCSENGIDNHANTLQRKVIKNAFVRLALLEKEVGSSCDVGDIDALLSPSMSMTRKRTHQEMCADI